MQKFHNGDRVIVPWGLDEIEGIVIDTFGPPSNPLVTVRVDFGQDEEGEAHSDIGFRAANLRHADVAPA